MKTRPRTHTGFTLTEMLVVMVIVAMLIGILVPVLARAKEQALRTQCMNNLRQVGMAYNMFCDDVRNGGYAPAVSAASIVKSTNAGFANWTCDVDADTSPEDGAYPNRNPEEFQVIANGDPALPGEMLIQAGREGELSTAPGASDAAVDYSLWASNVFYQKTATGGTYSGLGHLLEYMEGDEALRVLFCPSAGMFCVGGSAEERSDVEDDEYYSAIQVGEQRTLYRGGETAVCSYLYRGRDEVYQPRRLLVSAGTYGVRELPVQQRNTDFGQRNGAGARCIMEPISGGNGTCDTTANGSDTQEVAVGSSVSPGQILVTPGGDGVLDTATPGGDDVRRERGERPRMIAMDYNYRQLLSNGVIVIRSNHDNDYVNVLFSDGHVEGFENSRRPDDPTTTDDNDVRRGYRWRIFTLQNWHQETTEEWGIYHNLQLDYVIRNADIAGQ